MKKITLKKISNSVRIIFNLRHMQRELEAKLILVEKLYGKGLLAFSQGQPLSTAKTAL